MTRERHGKLYESEVPKGLRLNDPWDDDEKGKKKKKKKSGGGRSFVLNKMTKEYKEV